MNKRCSKCGVIKPIEDFARKGWYQSYASYCKQCGLAKLEQWKKDNAQRINAKRIKELNAIWHFARHPH